MKRRLSGDGFQRYSAMVTTLDFECPESLTPWQRKFVSSIKVQLSRDASLSIKQIDQIENIFYRHCP